jgi:hypothetical protein
MLLLIVLFSCSSQLSAQSLAYGNAAFSNGNALTLHPDYLPQENETHHHTKGTYGMIVGDSLMVVGGAISVAGISHDQDHAGLNGAEFIGAMGAVAGVYVFVISGIVYLVHKNREAHNTAHINDRFSIIGNKDQIGLAYNF